jgi:hypothetical protein
MMYGEQARKLLMRTFHLTRHGDDDIQDLGLSAVQQS